MARLPGRTRKLHTCCRACRPTDAHTACGRVPIRRDRRARHVALHVLTRRHRRGFDS